MTPSNPGSPEPPVAREGGPIDRRFGRDVLWNVASLGVLAVSGVLLNTIIGRIYGPAALGVFNQVVAAYVISSQAAAGGINYSVLKCVAEEPGNRQRVVDIVTGALAPAALLSALVAGAFFLSRQLVAEVLQSPGVEEGIAAATLGLFFFGINKVLFSVVNGLRRMRAFAVYQSLRYILILVGLLVAYAMQSSPNALAFVFTFSESILCVVMLIEIRSQLGVHNSGDWRGWIGRHLSFGMQSVLSAMMVELNARVDVLMLGYYLDDERVGVYSLAAFVAEGVYQFIAVFQRNLDPIVAERIASKQWEEIKQTVRSAERRITPAMAALGIFTIAAFPFTLVAFAGREAFSDSILPCTILVGGLVLSSLTLPFANTLLMGGQPLWHTVFMMVAVGANVIANALLIPTWGIDGSALGTAVSYVFSALSLILLVRWRIGFWLF